MLHLFALVIMGIMIHPADTTIDPDYKAFLDGIYPSDIQTISVEDFKDINKKNVFVLDTREKDEYQVSHLKVARQVGFIWFDMRDVYDIPKDATLVVYCSIGNRSSRIAQKLSRAGYTSVYVLYGGIFEWVNEGNPVYTRNNIQTSEVHIHNKEVSKWLEKGNKVY